jgi:hypothetical protein
MIKAGEHKSFLFEEAHDPYRLEERDANFIYFARKETDGREAQLPALDDFPHR